MSEYVEVAILGAGGIGFFLASELVNRHVSCALIDESSAARYSSTRNQGWLQSGVYYIGQNMDLTAQACSLGHQRITTRFPRAVHYDIPCYALFENTSDLKDVTVRSKELLGRSLTVPSNAEVAALQKDNPFVGATGFSYIARTPDQVIDTEQLLQFTQLPRYVAYCKLVSADGTVREFKLHTPPPAPPPASQSSTSLPQVRTRSRERYGTPREQVEQEIRRRQARFTGAQTTQAQPTSRTVDLTRAPTRPTGECKNPPPAADAPKQPPHPGPRSAGDHQSK